MNVTQSFKGRDDVFDVGLLDESIDDVRYLKDFGDVCMADMDHDDFVEQLRAARYRSRLKDPLCPHSEKYHPDGDDAC